MDYQNHSWILTKSQKVLERVERTWSEWNCTSALKHANICWASSQEKRRENCWQNVIVIQKRPYQRQRYRWYQTWNGKWEQNKEGQEEKKERKGQKTPGLWVWWRRSRGEWIWFKWAFLSCQKISHQNWSRKIFWSSNFKSVIKSWRRIWKEKTLW